MPQPSTLGPVPIYCLSAPPKDSSGVHGLAGVDVADVAGVPVERGLELEADALEADRRPVGVLAGGLLAQLPHLGGVGAGPVGAFLGDLLEPLSVAIDRIAATEIGGGEPEVGDHAEIDRRAAGKADGIEPDRDQLRAGRGALAEAVAEVEQHVGLAGIAHVAKLRADIERMPGRERLRPEAELAGLPGDRQAEQLGELDQSPCRRGTR